MSKLSFTSVSVYLLLLATLIGSAISDGDHNHDIHDNNIHNHEEAVSSSSATSGTATHTTSTGPTGTITTVHTASNNLDGGGGDGFSSILSNLSPDLIRSLSGNPQVAQALRAYGIDPNAAVAAAGASAAAGSTSQAGLAGGGYNYPSPPSGLGELGGIGGFPGLGFGPFKSLHVSGNYGLFYPFVEKAIVIVGGGIIILVIIALLLKVLAKGGLIYSLGSSMSEALAGSASAALDLGPIHKSVAGAAAVSGSAGVRGPSPMLTQRVYDGLDQQF